MNVSVWKHTHRLSVWGSVTYRFRLSEFWIRRIGFVSHFNTTNDIEDSYETIYDRRHVTATETNLNETYVKNSSGKASIFTSLFTKANKKCNDFLNFSFILFMSMSENVVA
jgi:hypothetical protein